MACCPKCNRKIKKHKKTKELYCTRCGPLIPSASVASTKQKQKELPNE